MNAEAIADLPPGHHHVHVGEDGTITAVPMRPLYPHDPNRDTWVDIEETP